MITRLAVVVLAGAIAPRSFAADISQSFIGVTNQSDGPGIFNVPPNGAPVFGSLTFIPSAFTPYPAAPSGSAYLDVFSGSANSVVMTLGDAGGTLRLDALSAFLELSSTSAIPWALDVSFDQYSFVLVLQSPHPVIFSSGSSIFDLADLDGPGSGLSALLGDSTHSLGFDMVSVSAAPEPSSWTEILVASGLAACFLRQPPRSRRQAVP